MIEHNDLERVRNKLKEKLLTRQMQAAKIGMDYPGYTRFLNGGPIGEKNYNRCLEYLNEDKNKLK